MPRFKGNMRLTIWNNSFVSARIKGAQTTKNTAKTVAACFDILYVL